MENLNLNIDSYKHQELLDLFDLNEQYTTTNILESKENLTRLLSLNNSLGMNQKFEIVSFIDTACSKLKNHLNETTHFDSGTTILIKDHNEVIGKNAKLTEGRVSIHGESLPGNLNPINIRTINETVNIDSRFRQNYDLEQSNDFTIYLPEPQKKVVKMRIISIELPVTYYSIMNEYNNNKCLLYCNYKPEFTIGKGNFPQHLEARRDVSYCTTQINGAGLYTSDTNNSQVENIKYVYAADKITWNNGGGTAENVGLSNWHQTGLSYEVSYKFDTHKFTNLNTSSGNARMKSFADNIYLENIKSTYGTETDKVPAWLLTFADGNYEKYFFNDNKGAKISDQFSSALLNAIPGYLSGPDFKNFIKIQEADNIKHTQFRGTDVSRNPLSMLMHQGSGKALIHGPLTGTSTIDTLLTHHGYSIRWQIDSEGNWDNNQSRKLKLGWFLGFRDSETMSNGGVSQYKTNSTLDTSFNLSTAGMMLSDGIPILSNPSYGFLAITDYTKSKCSKFKVALADSYLDDDIITKLNLAYEINNVGFSKTSENAGLFSSRNSVREYYGPVDIQKLRIKIYDLYGRPLNLNNSDWSITLAFEKLYD